MFENLFVKSNNKDIDAYNMHKTPFPPLTYLHHPTVCWLHEGL